MQSATNKIVIYLAVTLFNDILVINKFSFVLFTVFLKCCFSIVLVCKKVLVVVVIYLLTDVFAF